MWTNTVNNLDKYILQIRQIRLQVSGDKQRIEAHKLILSCGSDFFRAVLAENQNPHPLIYMRGTEAKVLASVVAFIYHGQV